MSTAVIRNPYASPGIANPVSIRAIRTGSVRVRTNQVRGKGPEWLRRLNTFLGQEWSEWLPIHAWVIGHPEGLIVVDTGEVAMSTQPGYFPRWHPYFRHGVEFDIHPDEELGPQLRDCGYDPRDVRKAIVTHLHTDHAGGLHHLPDSEVLIDRAAFAEASGWMGLLRGFLPNRWPTWLKPTLLDVEPTPFGPFDHSLPVTKTGDVVIVPTPGHTPHHLSVIVRTPGVTWFLAGDTSYTQELLLTGKVDGISPNANIARDTLARIRTLAAMEPLVYLPSHDPEAAQRLERGEAIPMPRDATWSRT